MSTIDFIVYRVSTITRSFRVLYSLSQDKIDAFLDSYVIYDHDWENEEELIREMGPDYYEQVKRRLIDYYSVLNHLCALGQVEKMYIPPLIDASKGIIANQNLFEEKMAKDLGISKESRVVDLGCGRGRVASHIASFTGAHVTGVNIDNDQLESAKEFALRKGMNEQCDFILRDMNDVPLPFADNSIDAFYEIQAFSLSNNLDKLFADIYRSLKPGGRIACLDWFRLDRYDPKNPDHADLMRRIKPLIGAIGTPSIQSFTEAMQKAGFKIVINENASVHGFQYPLIENADRYYSWLSGMISWLVRIKILPVHFLLLLNRLTKDGEAFIEADRKGLVTTSQYIVGQK